MRVIDIVHLEDCDHDADLLRQALEDTSIAFHLRRIGEAVSAVTWLRQVARGDRPPPDLIISDLQMISDIVDDEFSRVSCPTALLTGMDPLASGVFRVGGTTDLVLHKPYDAAGWDLVARQILDVLSTPGVG